jgi:hypothetical protein
LQGVRVEGLDGRECDPLAASSRSLAFVFVRSDCPIANRYAPEVQRIGTEYADQVELVLVYPDRDETAESIRGHLRDYGFRCRAPRDPRLEFARAVEARVTPEVAVFDPARRLVYCGRIDNRFADFGEARPKPTSRDLIDVLEALACGEPLEFRRTPAVGCFLADLQ